MDAPLGLLLTDQPPSLPPTMHITTAAAPERPARGLRLFDESARESGAHRHGSRSAGRWVDGAILLVWGGGVCYLLGWGHGCRQRTQTHMCLGAYVPLANFIYTQQTPMYVSTGSRSSRRGDGPRHPGEERPDQRRRRRAAHGRWRCGACLSLVLMDASHVRSSPSSPNNRPPAP